MSTFTFVVLHKDNTNEKHNIDIYLDDTIENIKTKLSEKLEVKNIHHYYLFYKNTTIYNPYDTYKELSLDGNRSITSTIYDIFCLNHNLPLSSEKDKIYELEDFLTLELKETEKTVPIGISRKTAYVVNPFDNKFNQIEDSSTTSKELLMNYNNINGKEIYVCIAQEVIEYCLETQLEPKQVINVYYPYLFQQNQFEVSQLKPEESSISKYKEYNEMIDFLHSKYKPELKPEQGISDIYFVIYSLIPIDFPIHVFFKLIQTSLKTPFIKLNGKKKSEHLYRLYCNQLSDKGNSVPLISKKELIKHGVPLKNTNHLCYYFQEKNLIMEIDQTGNIFFRLHDIKLTSMSEVEKIVRETSNEIIDKLLEYFDPSNKIFSHFKSFQEKNIEIIEITYKFLYKKEKRLDLKKYMSCFSCVLNYIDDKNDITKLRYKRVSDFNVTESMDAYLIEAVNKQLSTGEIGYGNEEEVKKKYTQLDTEDYGGNESVRSLIYNFAVNFKNNNIEEATAYINKFFENIQLSQEVGKNRLRRVKTNPGFLIEIKMIDKYYEVKVHSIDDIKYVEFIELFITDLMLMSQGMITDDGKCFKKVKEVEISEIINKAPIVDIVEESVDFDIVLNKDEDMFDFDSSDEEKEEKKEKEDIDLDLDESSDLEELSPNQDEEPKKENSPEIQEMSSEEVNLNEQETKGINLNNTVEDKDESSDFEKLSSNEESPELMGGSFKYNSNESFLVFIYDNNDPDTMIKKYGKNLKMDEAKVNDFYRAFDDDKCSIIEKKDTSVKGFSVTLTSEQFKQFVESNEGTKPIEVNIYDKAGNVNNGVSYQRSIDKFYNEPGLSYLKHVYATIEYGWKKKHMDEPGIIYIYDKNHELKGKFNNVSYIKKGEEIKIDLESKNPFLKRMQERQPILFPQEDDKEFKYSRACQWSDRRTPVIITKEEKDEIDELAPGAYDSVLEYSTDPEKPYYYICPRYWDLKTMRPVKPEDVDKSKLIPSDATAKEIKRDIQSKYILEFSKKGEFHPRIGFLTKHKRDDGYFLPCCFKQSEKKETKKGENVVGRVTTEALSFYQESKKKLEESKKEKSEGLKEKVAETKSEPIKLTIIKKPETIKYTENILNGDKFPLDEHRRGHLTPILERFFEFKYTQCYSNIQKKKLKLNTPCLLRRGVEHNTNQSFLAAMAFIMNQKHTTISEFKTKILNVINIDNIQSFHGGNIVHSFYKPDYESQDISKYTNSKLYKTFRGNETAFKKIVNGYENFRNYLLSNEYIDYTYLWDILCSELLYKSRINIVILHEDMQDPTHNLTIVCPTTTHSDYRFNPKLPSCILYRYGNYFEPLFSYSESEKEYSETKFFNIDSQIPILSSILKKINEHIGDLCKETSVNKKYIFKMNLYLDKLIKELQKLNGYSVDKQIMNFDGRIIGLMVTKDDDSFFVPCRASQVTGDYELIHDDLWNNYNKTLSCLVQLNKDSNGSIPCKPRMKMIEDSMIIGILTETNQMIPLSEPEENNKQDGLQEVDEHSYVIYDRHISEHPMKNEKAKVIKNLKLEQSFYNAFFNTIKVKVNDIENLSLKMNIQQIIKSNDAFDKKLNSIKDIISSMVEDHFEFIQYDTKILDEIDDINLCKSKEQPYCSFESNDGKLLIPIKNLFNRLNNKELYVNRFIDDIISNFYIQDQFFNEIHSTIFYTDKFNLTKNEILLLENLIPYYYDENSTIVKNIPSLQHRTIEDVQPNDILDVLETIAPIEPILEEDIVEPVVDDIEFKKYKKSEEDDIEEEDYSSEEEEMNDVLVKGKKELSVIPEELEESTKKTVEQPIQKPVEEIKQAIKEVTKLIIVAPPKKKKVEFIEAKEKITSAVEKAKELVEKENSPEHQELLAETKELMEKVKEIEKKPLVSAPEKIQLKIVADKKLHETLIDPSWKECITDVAYLTEKWKKYFKGTKDFRIGVGKTYHAKEQNPKCNLYMALNILKDYNPEIYRDYKVKDVKEMLIKMYEDYIQYRQFILLKWKQEKEKDYPLTKETKIENIILNETYEFSEVDMVLMTFYYNLPVVFFHQGKDKIKMLRRENHTEDYSYYIKMKGSSIFMLFWQHKKTFKIYDADLKSEHKKDLFETRMSLKDYLENEDFYYV